MDSDKHKADQIVERDARSVPAGRSSSDIAEDALKLSRRMTIIAALSSVTQPLWIIGKDLLDQNRKEREALREARDNQVLQWAKNYFCPINEKSDDRVVLIAGWKDVYDTMGPKKRSESGEWVASKFIDAFPAEHLVQKEDAGEIKRSDHLVLIASSLVNPDAAKFAGEIHKNGKLRVHHSGRPATSGGHIGAYEAELRWKVFTPPGAPELKLLQTRFGTPDPVERFEPEHAVYDSSKPNKPFLSVRHRRGKYDQLDNDYAVISVLPTDSTKTRRVVSLAGKHRTGTLGAGKFFEELPFEILQKLHGKTGRTSIFSSVARNRSGQQRVRQGTGQAEASNDGWRSLSSGHPSS